MKGGAGRSQARHRADGHKVQAQNEKAAQLDRAAKTDRAELGREQRINPLAGRCLESLARQAAGGGNYQPLRGACTVWVAVLNVVVFIMLLLWFSENAC